MAIDLVCRMHISEEKAQFRAEYKGVEYYFCGLGCKERFEKDPERYLGSDHVDWIEG